MARAKRFNSNNKAVLSARGGHRAVSAATKAKIAASLRGNKNAFRGGPKQRLTQRQKVANINAHTRENKANLSDAQLRQRSAVAKRLRARARAEEAGIQPAHSKPIPTPDTITQRDSKLRADASRVRGSIAKAETKSAGPNSQLPDSELKKAFKASAPRSMERKGISKEMERRFNVKAQKDIANSKKRLDALGIDAHGNKVANANTGKGNFNKQNNVQAADRPISKVDQSRQAAEIVRLNEQRRRDEANDARKSALKFARGGLSSGSSLGSRKAADRSNSAKIVDPTVKMNKGRTLPKAEGNKTLERPSVLASRYVRMHGASGAQKKIAQMEKRVSLSPRNRDLLEALKIYAKVK